MIFCNRTVLFVVTLATASVSALVSTNTGSSVKNENECSKYNQGYHDGYQKGDQDGFIDGRNCKEARIFSMIYYAPCSSGYNGGYSNGYRPGFY
jgi:hypothetical protein